MDYKIEYESNFYIQIHLTLILLTFICILFTNFISDLIQ